MISVEWLDFLRMSSLVLCGLGSLFLLFFFIKDLLKGEVW